LVFAGVVLLILSLFGFAHAKKADRKLQEATDAEPKELVGSNA
jgi:hypothetical protein